MAIEELDSVASILRVRSATPYFSQDGSEPGSYDRRSRYQAAVLGEGTRLRWSLLLLAGYGSMDIGSRRCPCPNPWNLWILPYMAKDTLPVWLN